MVPKVCNVCTYMYFNISSVSGLVYTLVVVCSFSISLNVLYMPVHAR